MFNSIAGKWFGITLGAAAFGFVAAGTAVAGSTAITTLDRTSQPIGHYEFCKRRPAECSVRSPVTAPEAMTDLLRAKLEDVNDLVNASVTPMEDIDIFGRNEVWVYPGNVGDCEDYVLEKRRILAESGIPLANLLITVVRQANGDGHAVLTVRTDTGDYVLDNLSSEVLPWDHTGYVYVKRQSVEDTGEWVSIRDGEAPLVGSVH